ncbi:hypothetical protein ON010_g14846 [Phytophthora cinnamomi]|nr:hypothetical protein ON010_g14846 [Phytophthora cinnamomi]
MIVEKAEFRAKTEIGVVSAVGPDARKVRCNGQPVGRATTGQISPGTQRLHQSPCNRSTPSRMASPPSSPPAMGSTDPSVPAAGPEGPPTAPSVSLVDQSTANRECPQTARSGS